MALRITEYPIVCLVLISKDRGSIYRASELIAQLETAGDIMQCALHITAFRPCRARSPDCGDGDGDGNGDDEGENKDENENEGSEDENDGEEEDPDLSSEEEEETPVDDPSQNIQVCLQGQRAAIGTGQTGNLRGNIGCRHLEATRGNRRERDRTYSVSTS